MSVRYDWYMKEWGTFCSPGVFQWKSRQVSWLMDCITVSNGLHVVFFSSSTYNMYGKHYTSLESFARSGTVVNALSADGNDWTGKEGPVSFWLCRTGSCIARSSKKKCCRPRTPGSSEMPSSTIYQRGKTSVQEMQVWWNASPPTNPRHCTWSTPEKTCGLLFVVWPWVYGLLGFWCRWFRWAEDAFVHTTSSYWTIIALFMSRRGSSLAQWLRQPEKNVLWPHWERTPAQKVLCRLCVLFLKFLVLQEVG